MGLHGSMWQQFERWLRTDQSWWRTHLFAVLVTLLLATVLATSGVSPRFPLGLVLLFPVVLSAYVGGLWPGLLSTLIAVGIASPLLRWMGSFTNSSGLPIASWTMSFLCLGGLISLLVEALHRSRRRSEAEQRLHISTLANVNDAIITTDPGGHIEYMNRAAVALLMHDLVEVSGQPFEAVVDIRDELNGAKSDSLPGLARSANTTVHAGIRQILLRPDGQQIPIEAVAAPVRDQSGTLISVVLTIRNCSEQRLTESALHERLTLQARFERIAAVVPGAIHEIRIFPDGRYQLSYASPSFREVLGIDPTLVLGDVANLSAMLYPEDKDRVWRAAETAMRELKSIDIEYRVLTPHRGIRWVCWSAVPSREADGSTFWHGIFMDVTERKRADERLRASQLQLHAALEAGDMGMLKIDLTSDDVDMDKAARRLWHLQTVAEPLLVEKHLMAKIHPDSQKAVRDDYRHMHSGPQLHSGEYHLLLEDGQERWLLCRGRIYQDETTGHLVKVGVLMDTTHHRRKEQQHLHSQKLEALGVLAGGIAHDFNNLLLAISGNAKLLLEDLSHADPLLTSVREIDKAAARAAELVRRILSFSSVQDLNQAGRPTPLRPVLDEVLGLARAVLPATVTIKANIPEQLPAVLADSSQIHQTLINLLTNAADAAVSVDGEVSLDVAVVDVDATLCQLTPELQLGRYVRLSVSDRGVGIEPEILQRIFDPFFTTKPTGRGTGLGLAIVHGIMKSIEGAVTVSSAPGNGSTFSLYFPVERGVSLVAKTETKILPPARAAHILYVDDEEALIFLMTRTLQRMGHRVTACISPAEALQVFSANTDDFDLVVSDMTMPGMSGIELAAQVLALRPQLPFIITSGYVDAADVERAQAVGVRQMIMKPNTVDELSEVLGAILQEEVMASA